MKFWLIKIWVLVHNGHLVVAIGDKPLIVALRDVEKFLEEGVVFDNAVSHEFCKWQFPPREIMVQHHKRGTAPLSEYQKHQTSCSTISWSSDSINQCDQCFFKPDQLQEQSRGSLYSSQAPENDHTMDAPLIASAELHQKRTGAISGNGSLVALTKVGQGGGPDNSG